MKKSVKAAFIFSAGAAVGSILTWKLVKTRYERIAQKEIDSVKAVFSRRKAETSERKEKEPEENNRTMADEAREKPDIAKYTEKLMEYGYIYEQDDTRPEKRSDESVKKETERPYVIDPDDFGEFDDYDKISLTYYSDGILADDQDEIIEDIDDIIGSDSLGHFGEYEDDAVHVRNDMLKADYEILRDFRTYEETVREEP